MIIKAGFDPGWLNKHDKQNQEQRRYQYGFREPPEPSVTVRDQQPFLYFVEDGQLMGCFNDPIGFAPSRGQE